MIMKITIKTLIENNPDKNEKYVGEHGLSLYIEAGSHHYLFDTGQSGDFLENAKKMNMNLTSIEKVFLSHGHYDHTGGLKALIQEYPEFPQLYVGEEFFIAKYKTLEDGILKFIGNPFDETYLEEKGIIPRKVKEDFLEIEEGIYLFHHFQQITDYEMVQDKFLIMEDGVSRKDFFDDEICLAFDTEQGLLVIVGCSHIGIINMLKTIQERTGKAIYGVVGGTHLIEADQDRLEQTLNAFEELNIQLFGLSHCTGDSAMKEIEMQFGDKFVYNNTGNEIFTA